MSETKLFSTFKKEELFVQLLNSIDKEILGGGGKTLEEQWEAFHRGEYGYSSIMGLVVDVLAHGGSVEHLRGEYPDLMLDDLAKHFKKAQDEEKSAEEPCGVIQ